MRKPFAKRNAETGSGDANSFFTADSKTTPRMPTGIVPATSSHPVRSSGSSLKRPRTMLATSARTIAIHSAR